MKRLQGDINYFNFFDIVCQGIIEQGIIEQGIIEQGIIEQDFTAGPNLAMHAGFCPKYPNFFQNPIDSAFMP